jgi:nitric-oxide synthase
MSNRGGILHGRSPAAIPSTIIDHIVHVHPLVAVALYVPVIAITAEISLDQASPLALAGWAIDGYLTWTLVEYWGHRLVLHFEPEQGWGAWFHHIVHGMHHEYPQDPRRCVMSPLLSIPIVTTAVVVSLWVLGLPAMFAAGFVHGYLAYDLIHLYLHHARPNAGPMKWLQELHMRHHFRDRQPRLWRLRPVPGQGVRHLHHPRAAGCPVTTTHPHTAGDGSPRPADAPPDAASGDAAVPGYRATPTPRWDPRAPTDIAEAEAFLRLFHTENPGVGDLHTRLSVVAAEIAATGTYTHTTAELTFGARVAWRNSSRCIGRLYWRSLRVFDRRDIHDADGIFTHLVEHLRSATNDGNVRPTITIFPPAQPGHPYARVWNEQLIRYAGHRRADGSVVGDPRYTHFTSAVTAMGWIGKGTAFDILPLVIDTPAEGPRLFDLPEDAVSEVPLAHPEYPWFAELDLRWHIVPTISHMRLTIGGIHYPCAPFNGWYMGAEIGARNLADTDRYDLLPVVATRLDLDTSSEGSLWRDRALVELNIAVLHSFTTAGAQISNHHTEAERFCTHVDREARAGRAVPADWTWIVPPMSGAATPVFHRYYHEADLRPNFYLDPEARHLALQDPDIGPTATTLPLPESSSEQVGAAAWAAQS